MRWGNPVHHYARLCWAHQLKKSIFSKNSRNGRIDWDPTMQVIPWVGCQSKIESPNSEIIETGRRKGRKKNEGFRVKMDKNIEKVKKVIKFNHEIV